MIIDRKLCLEYYVGKMSEQPPKVDHSIEAIRKLRGDMDDVAAAAVKDIRILVGAVDPEVLTDVDELMQILADNNMEDLFWGVDRPAEFLFHMNYKDYTGEPNPTKKFHSKYFDTIGLTSEEAAKKIERGSLFDEVFAVTAGNISIGRVLDLPQKQTKPNPLA